jgi:sterol 3beta-glucosyltransferase
MHVAILTIGSHGDVQPYVALGVALKDAGHTVTLATSVDFEPFVCQYGLDFTPIAGGIRELLETDEGRQVLSTAGRPVRMLRGIMRIVRRVEPLIDQIVRDVSQACLGADRVIAASLLYYYSDYIAQVSKAPVYLGSTGPKAPTRAFQQIWFPDLSRLPLGVGGYNLLTHRVAGRLLRQFQAPLLAQPWRRAFDEPLLAKMPKRRLPTLYCYSTLVIPKPADWGADQHVTGYWFLDSKPDWQPPADLVDFIRSGPPPVCIGFGSMNCGRPDELTRIVVQALKRSGQRGILLTGWGGVRVASLPDDVFVAGMIPYAWLFPQAVAVVHHGGAGTTGECLRAGVPSINVPFFADQPFWAQHVYALGIGPRPVPRNKLSVERLAEAISTAVGDADMRRRAAALGQRIRAENGVQRAVELIIGSGD